MTGSRGDDARVRTVFIGSGGFGVRSLRRLASHDEVDLLGVVTAPPRPAGRAQERLPTRVHAAANELGIKTILTPERLRAPASVAEVLALQPELLVLADYGQIVPAALLEVRHGALNLHPSLLPRHRGATPIPAAILAGDTQTGVTLMRMDEGLDTGPIVDQVRLPLDGTETTPELEARLADMAAALLSQRLEPWLAGEMTPRPQDDSAATLTRPFRREDGRLDPMRPTAELERQVRALQPWPGAFVEAPSGRIKVFAAEVLQPAVDQRPSTFVPDDGDGLAIATIDGRLRLLEVQSAGGRRMSGSDFRRGLNSANGFFRSLIGRLP